MSEKVVYIRASRAAIRQAIAAIPQEARAGGAAANAMMLRCGFAALGRIKRAFVTKARGGTDEAGDRWQPLSPKTIAYSRRHPGLPPAKARAAKRPSWALTEKQRNRWWDLYRQGLAIVHRQGGAISRETKAGAAKRAWAISKKEGATTLLDKYGNTQVEILRDTGLLLNSLSPGVASAEQIFRVGKGEVIIGTNRKGAAAHHSGIPGRLPQRRLWPDPRKWPASWWMDIAEQARQGLLEIAMMLIRDAK